jgi:hypothetical protein
MEDPFKTMLVAASELKWTVAIFIKHFGDVQPQEDPTS